MIKTSKEIMKGETKYIPDKEWIPAEEVEKVLNDTIPCGELLIELKERLGLEQKIVLKLFLLNLNMQIYLRIRNNCEFNEHIKLVDYIIQEVGIPLQKLIEKIK